MLSLQNYLKKYTTISNKFIDDFFDLYDNTTNQDDYVINLDAVTKWLKIRKDNIKRILISMYIINIDYTIKRTKSSSGELGGRPIEKIMLTPECFKRLCMLSRSSKAEEVRSYFIQLEKHIDKYKNYIIDALNVENNKLKNNQKPIVNPQRGIIYVLKSDDNLLKLGRSDKTKSRIRTHNTSHPDNVEVLFVFETDNSKTVENCLKSLITEYQYRKRKEFYEIDIDLLKELIADCDGLMLKARYHQKKFKHSGGFFIMFDKCII